MGILTDVGVLKNGAITPEAREAFVDSVNTLLVNGHDGSFFPTPDNLYFSGTPLIGDSFNIKPIADHEAAFPTWHMVWIDVLFQETAKALDVDGATPLAPIMDPTILPAKIPDLKLKADLTLPDILEKVLLPLPPPGIFELFDIDLVADVDLVAELALQLPTLIAPPISLPSIPPLPLPTDFLKPSIPDLNLDISFRPPSIPPIFPAIPPLHLPNLQLTNIVLVIGCFFQKIITTVIPLILADSLGLVESLVSEGPAGLIIFISIKVLDAILSCLLGIELKNALSFLAAFIVYLARVVAMLAVVLVGLILGSGFIAQSIAEFTNLV